MATENYDPSKGIPTEYRYAEFYKLCRGLPAATVTALVAPIGACRTDNTSYGNVQEALRGLEAYIARTDHNNIPGSVTSQQTWK